jgi:hypothetical protein
MRRIKNLLTLFKLKWKQFVKQHIVDEYPYDDEM